MFYFFEDCKNFDRVLILLGGSFAQKRRVELILISDFNFYRKSYKARPAAKKQKAANGRDSP